MLNGLLSETMNCNKANSNLSLIVAHHQWSRLALFFQAMLLRPVPSLQVGHFLYRISKTHASVRLVQHQCRLHLMKIVVFSCIWRSHHPAHFVGTNLLLLIFLGSGVGRRVGMTWRKCEFHLRPQWVETLASHQIFATAHLGGCVL